MLDPFGTAGASFEQTGAQLFSPRNAQASVTGTVVWIETRDGQPRQMHVQQAHSKAAPRGREGESFEKLSLPYDFSSPSQATEQFDDPHSEPELPTVLACYDTKSINVDNLASESVKHSQSPESLIQNTALHPSGMLVAQLDVVIVGMEFVLK